MSIDSTFVRRAATSAAVVLLAAAPAAAQSARRVALVLGNSDYEHISRLPNPGNDAADMSAALRRLDFEVTTELDADRTELNDALRAFTLRSVGADVSLVFYAGHGMEMDGVNYLLPVDARLRYDTQVRYETVRLDDVLAATTGASLRIVILDACRDNPLAQSMQRTDPDRSISRGSLAALDEGQLGNETLVAYAAEAGKTVPDGRGRNSPYTSALLEYLEEPLELVTMFRRVRNRVLEETNQGQRPWEYQSLRSDHYLAGEFDVVTTTDEDDTIRAQQETVFWQSITNSTDPADFEAYLGQYPTGAFRALAANRVAALRGWEREAGEVFRDNCAGCPELVVVPAGRFRMGCVSGGECQDDKRPVHEVDVASFALGVHEVTRDEYGAFVAATGHAAGDRCFAFDEGEGSWGWREGVSWRSPGYPQAGDHPVVCVSWEDAQAYVRWLSGATGERYRLPSESEWEYAALAGATTRRPWGDESGEQWEWVEDCWHDDYDDAPRDGSAWTRGGDCGRRVLRGGSWNDHPVALRSANRSYNAAGARLGDFGFRVSRTLD